MKGYFWKTIFKSKSYLCVYYGCQEVFEYSAITWMLIIYLKIFKSFNHCCSLQFEYIYIYSSVSCYQKYIFQRCIFDTFCLNILILIHFPVFAKAYINKCVFTFTEKLCWSSFWLYMLTVELEVLELLDFGKWKSGL